MYWQKRFDKINKDAVLEEKIIDIRANHKNYGYRRIYGHLRNQGIIINKKKVQRLVQKLKLQVTSFGRKSKYSSYKGNIGKLSDNLVNRNFKSELPHQKITTDTSEFKYYTTDDKGNMRVGKLYLNAFLDMYNSEIISYSISKRPTIASNLNPTRRSHQYNKRLQRKKNISFRSRMGISNKSIHTKTKTIWNKSKYVKKR